VGDAAHRFARLVVRSSVHGPAGHHRSPSCRAGIQDRQGHHYDPEGDDGQENDNLAAFAIDGQPATVWSTLCYGSRTLGGKTGVGIVADLGAAAIGTFTVAVASAPYQIQVLTAGDGSIPAQIADWVPR